MKIKILFLLIFLSCISVTKGTAEPITLLLAYEDKEQPPYYYGYGTKVPPKPGIAVDIVKQIEKKILNLKINLVRYPWKRCLFHLQKGEVDGIFKATYRQKREKLGRYPLKNGKIDTGRKIAVISNSLYKLKPVAIDWNGKRLNPLKGYVCVPRSYAIAASLKNSNIHVVESDSSNNCLKKVMYKRVIAAALQTVTGDALLEKYSKRYKQIVKITPPLSNKPQYLMLSHQFVKRYPVISEKIWNSIALIRKENLDEISQQYVD